MKQKQEKDSSVSIIVLNLNGKNVISSCLNSVLKTHYPDFEVIVWDNGSDKKEVETLKKLFKKKVHFFFSGKNYGFAEANNKAVLMATGKYLVFLNNDTEVEPDWLELLIQKMKLMKDKVILQPKIIAQQDHRFFNYHGAAGGFIDTFGYTFARGRIFDYLEEDLGQYDDERSIFWASGVSLVIAKKLFLRLGGFENKFFACQEEVDFCFRAKRARIKVLVVPKSKVYHLGSVTLNRNLSTRVFLNHRNQLFLLFRHLKPVELFWVFPARIFLDVFASLYYLFHLNVPLFLSVFKAYCSFIINFFWLMRTRLTDKFANFGFPRDGTVYRGNIIFDYFFLKKRRFSEIFHLKYSGKISERIPVKLNSEIVKEN